MSSTYFYNNNKNTSIQVSAFPSFALKEFYPRTEHCNKEESKATHIARKTFYCDEILLTFTNQITHKIILKIFRYPQVSREEKNQTEQMLDQVSFGLCILESEFQNGWIVWS